MLVECTLWTYYRASATSWLVQALPPQWRRPCLTGGSSGSRQWQATVAHRCDFTCTCVVCGVASLLPNLLQTASVRISSRGWALKYILYSSLVEVKFESQAKNLQLVKGQTWLIIVNHDRYYQNINVNVKLQKYTRIWSKVKWFF